MAVPIFWNLVRGLGRGHMQVHFSTLHHKGTQFWLGTVGCFSNPNKMLAPSSGGVSGVVPQKIMVGVRALNCSCIEVRKNRVCAVLTIEVRRKSGRCSDLEQSRSTFQFWVWPSFCVTLS